MNMPRRLSPPSDELPGACAECERLRSINAELLASLNVLVALPGISSLAADANSRAVLDAVALITKADGQ